LFAYRFFFAGFHLPRQGFSIGTSNVTHGRKPGKRFLQQGAICGSMTKGCSEYRPASGGNVGGMRREVGTADLESFPLFGKAARSVKASASGNGVHEVNDLWRGYGPA
jgi:hypothetical protein